MKKQWGPLFFAGMCVICLLMGCGKEETGRESREPHTEEAGRESQESHTEETGPVNGRRFRPVDPEEAAKGLENPERPEFEKEDVRGISVAENGEILYQINYTPQPDKESYLYWDMAVPYGSAAVVNTEAMYGLYETAAGLDLTQASAPEEDREHEDLSDADTYITLNYYDNGGGSEQKDEPNKTLTLLIGEKTEGLYHCSLKGYEGQCMMLQAPVLDAVLRQDPYDLILKIPYVVNMATVREVDISYQGKDCRMTLEGDTYRIQDQEVEMEEYRALYSALMQPMLDGRIPEGNEPEDGREPLISMDYIRNMEEADDYIVRIYPFEGGKYTVSVNGEEHFFLAAEDVQVLEEVLEKAF